MDATKSAAVAALLFSGLAPDYPAATAERDAKLKAYDDAC